VTRAKLSETEARQAWYPATRDLTLETLPGFLRSLAEDYEHDYGTIAVAIAAAALAAARAMDKTEQGGITGFQAGAVFWEFTRDWAYFPEGPKRMQIISDMLYPQNEDKFASTIDEDDWEWLRDEAAKNLAGPIHEAHPVALNFVLDVLR
jgi:hypothetical protein